MTDIKDWPDRPGFWIVRHHWGMELVESFLHDDEEEQESPFAIRCHHGGNTNDQGPFFPIDLKPAPHSPHAEVKFQWLGTSFPFTTESTKSEIPIR